ncbi:hypothetical protein GCM10011613_24660 [Cellvibrio zantedeschiae]|uniref:Nicotinamide riboside transporter PnuC n=1 Tax=Cellvibrio zantedeschiae TaxID=1237077 RepID=A0ABQ3B5C0_9GAMM|nr:hypothetical protein [Cellvibrio zantedeschiae]GGY78953.1 hypothetical protein GCM10011613_24660 [Cellvibrio zantedeschiae]
MFAQFIIAITGVAAIFLSQTEKMELRKYACIFGLAGQPFWFYESFNAEKWGIFGLTFAYTAAWVKGIHLYWINSDKNKLPK